MTNTQESQSFVGGGSTGNDRPRRVSELSNDELRAVRCKIKERLTKVFSTLMMLGEGSHLQWEGSLTDLMELTHTIWLTGDITNRRGCQYNFCDMARHVCRVLNVRVPANPYSLVERAHHRKGVRNMPIIDRYVKLAVEGHIPCPMMLDIKLK